MTGIFLQSAVIAALAVMVLRPVAWRVGLLDRPDERKQHSGAVPLVGGIAVFLAVVLVMVLSGTPGQLGAVFAGGLLLLFTGLVDDVRRVGSTARLVIQSLAILMIIVGAETVISSLGGLGYGGQELRLVAFAATSFTVFCGVGLINAVNMADGLDGLSGSLSVVSLAALGLAAAYSGRQDELALICGLSGALVGFLAFNMRLPGRSRALIFLGDSGSYVVGFLIFYIVVQLTQGEEPAISPVTALWICAVPLFDTVSIIFRRMRKGRSPFVADREHIHHVLLLAGFTVSETVMIMVGAASLTAAAGLGAYYSGLPDIVSLAGFLILAGLYYRMIARAWTFMRFLNRSISRRRSREDRRGGRDRRRRLDTSIVAKLGRERRSGQDRRREPDRRHEDPPSLPQRGEAAGAHRESHSERSGSEATAKTR